MTSCDTLLPVDQTEARDKCQDREATTWSLELCCSFAAITKISIVIIDIETTTTTTTTNIMSDTAETAPVPLTYFANAQTDFASTIPLVANENAFLGDVAFR